MHPSDDKNHDTPDDADRDALDDVTRLARDGPLPAPVAAENLVGGDIAAEDAAAAAPKVNEPQVNLARPARARKLEESVALPSGHCLHEYRVLSVLGRGGFGITYLASDINLNAKVAIKEYLPEQLARREAEVTVKPRTQDMEQAYERGLESYLVEARTLATFRHPHIVRVARFFEANNTAYMVLEYERGESLKRWWARHSEISEMDLLLLFGPLLDGLAIVHEAGFLHRDIKPDNIYVRDSDGSLVLLDFGAARRAADELDDAAAIVTPGYGPIEQYVNAEQGAYTDLYAFAATLYWMVTGKKPPAAPDRMALVDPIRPAAEAAKGRYSDAFLKAIDWALSPESKDRPRDVAQWRVALYAAHPESLAQQLALNAGAPDAKIVGWGAGLRSPRLLKTKLMHGVTKLTQPGSWPLAARMMVAMVFAALVPMLVTALFNYRGSVERVSAGELRNLELLAASVAGRISQLLADSHNLGAYVANDNDFVDFLKIPAEAGKEAIRAKLEGLVRANPNVDVATILDMGGTALTSTDKSIPGGNFKFRVYFQEASQGRPHVTGIIVGATAGASGAYFASPVRNERGEVIGVVTLRIRASSLAAILETARTSSSRAAMLVDHDGIVLHHSDPSIVYKSLVRLPPDRLKAVVDDQRYRRTTIESLEAPDLAAVLVGAKDQGHANFSDIANRKPSIAGYAPVAGNDWVVAITESREYFEAPLRELFRSVLYSVGVVGIVFLIAAVVFARSIVRPIEALKDAAHALKVGDYDNATVRVTSTDEIGQLARVFNVMIDVLRQRERELGKRKRARS
jgi:serine/threonine protein kinase/HAMP domain-containing protein